MPAVRNDRPAHGRAMTTRHVSTVATNVNRKSSARRSTGLPDTGIDTAAEAITNPMNIEPVSPMNIRAGAQLCTRNPRQPADSATSNSARPVRPAREAAAARSVQPPTAVIAAAPSMLSSRLKEFVSTTIHAAVSTGSAQPPNTSIRQPQATTPAAARHSTVIRYSLGTGLTSSTRPTSAISRPAARRATSRRSQCGTKAAAEAAVPAAIATPPRYGVGRRCAFRMPGRSTSPHRGAHRHSASLSTSASTSAPVAAPTAAVTGPVTAARAWCCPAWHLPEFGEGRGGGSPTAARSGHHRKDR